jgi:hypothetical protein
MPDRRYCHTHDAESLWLDLVRVGFAVDVATEHFDLDLPGLLPAAQHVTK